MEKTGNSPERVLRRMKITAVLLSVAVPAVSPLFFPMDVVLGLTLGCIAGTVNFFWLDHVLEGAFKKQAKSGVPSEKSRRGILLLIAKYLFRLMLIGGLLCVIMLDRRISIVAAAVGFSIPLIAVVTEGIFSFSLRKAL